MILAELSTILMFNQFCIEEYKWWWNTFFYGAFPSVFVFFVSVQLFMQSMGAISAVVLSVLIAVWISLIGGAVTVLCGLKFNQIIFKKDKLA